MNTTELIPSAERLINSMRDVGYSFPVAIADIIDNSIDAGATEIHISAEFKGKDTWIRILDNGFGMTPSETMEAMRFGSRPYQNNSTGLGKFGLGLKTASISQCRHLIVASRHHQTPTKLTSYCWDLDYINSTDKWEVIKVSPMEIDELFPNNTFSHQGTAVIWKNLDRIIDQTNPAEEESKNKFLGLCRELEQHLAMVFHRFLSGEVPDKHLKIVLNGNEISAWDPFARDEQQTLKMTSSKIKLNSGIESGFIFIQPYVLPSKDQFTSKEAFNNARGPKKWNRQQGFYIYRSNRLIQSGGWSGLRTLDEHSKLARISIDFPNNLDEAFKIDISKMKIEIPSQIIDQIEESIKPVIKKADEVYRKESKNDNKVYKNNAPVNSIPSSAVSTKANKNEMFTNSNLESESFLEKKWTLEEVERMLIDIASQIEIVIIKKLFAKIKSRRTI